MIHIDEDKCIACGQCVADCIANNIEIKDKKATVKGECLQCGHCVAICRSDAVSIPDYDMDDVEKLDPDNRIDPAVLLSCIKARRSIRDYTEQKISEENLRLLAEAGRYTATAKNGQFHRYVFVQNDLDTLKDNVWNYIDNIDNDIAEYGVYKTFLSRKKADAADDYLFRNAPAVLFITSPRHLDAGLAAQNMEMMACSLGMGVLYNGFLARIADENRELKNWLGIENETICACMLLGYPKKNYYKTAPRKKAEIIIK